MIEVGVMTVLVATTAIVERISTPGAGNRIYLGRVPQGVRLDGGAIVVKKISATHDYGLVAEAGSKFATLTIDCYDLTPVDADSLAELVAAAASGEPAIGLVAGDHRIESSLIVSDRTEYQKPQGGTDDWRPRASRDYRIHYT